MTARKTGNELFDIFWKEYPARNGRKCTKSESLKWFKDKKPSEETVFDMIEWLKRDKESRSSLESNGLFCSPPKDAIRFLRKEVWADEIGEVVTESSQYEVNRSVSIRKKAVTSAIAQFQDIVGHRTKAELRENQGFMSAYDTYPEFREWAGKQTYKTYEAYSSPQPVKPDITEDLPPPSKKEKLVELYRDVERHRDNNPEKFNNLA
jgi:hypothetical protein